MGRVEGAASIGRLKDGSMALDAMASRAMELDAEDRIDVLLDRRTLGGAVDGTLPT